MQGLQNLGSTCAINSLIQIICRTPHLRDIILDIQDVPENTISCQLKEIINMMHNQGHSLSPKKFIGHLYRHFDGIFRQGEQLDICELWMFLYDRIASECGKPIDYTPGLSECINIHNLTNDTLASCQELHHLCNATMHKLNDKKDSKWLQSAQGIMLNMIKCNMCHNINYNFEPFTVIPLDLPTDSNKATISSMFRDYLKTQEACGDWKCEKCNAFTPYVKFVKIWKMPPVLVFVIKRFADMHVKNTKPVYINTSLNIKKNSVITNMHSDIQYACNAFGLHFGGLSGGHYCALCKTQDRWLLYDDLNIAEIQDPTSFFEGNQNTYMVMYSATIVDYLQRN